MDMHPNARIVHDASQNPGDFQAFLDTLSDDIVWHEIGRDEPIRGKQPLMRRFQSGGEEFTIEGSDHAAINAFFG
jgi:ketosteroid isomerase-like protein